MLNGLSLFTGIGGIDLALAPWVKPILYCEVDPYAQGVLASRMADGLLGQAPVWGDVRSLPGTRFRRLVDIIYGGFPCQDISVAGNGAGLAGKRSGLFFEIIRLVREIRPAFVFLENVPAITTRGLDRVAGEFSALRYDCRWGVLSAFDVGAPHLRERWFLLAHANGNGNGCEIQPQRHGQESQSEGKRRHDTNGLCDTLSHGHGHGHGLRQQSRRGKRKSGEGKTLTGKHGEERSMADTASRGDKRSKEQAGKPLFTFGCDETGMAAKAMADRDRERLEIGKSRAPRKLAAPFRASWWESEPDVGRVVNGLPHRVDRLRCLGNAVVPRQAREAFTRLMGLE